MGCNMRLGLLGVVLVALCCAALGNAGASCTLDEFEGIGIYSNTSSCGAGGTSTAPDGTYLGMKWQCVEFVRRFYYVGLDYRPVLPTIPSYRASDWWTMLSSQAGLSRYSNGATAPQKYDILVFSSSYPGSGGYGHVAIVREVHTSYVVLAEQNHLPIRRQVSRSGNTINSAYLLGWFRRPGGGSPPNPPVLVSPPHESHFIGRPVLNWDPVPGATKYQVRVRNGVSPGVHLYSPVISGDSWRIDRDITPKDGYWWEARAGNSAGWSAWSTRYRLWLAPYTEPFEADATTQDDTHNLWGWWPSNGDLATIHRPDGESWKLKVKGCDSQIESGPAFLDIGCNQLDIELANHTESQSCQLFWRRDNYDDFTSAYHINIPTTVDRSVVHATCYFHGDTVQFRFDPVNGCPGVDPDTGGTPYVEWYRIGLRRTVTWPNWEFDVENNLKGWGWDLHAKSFTRVHSIDTGILPHGGVWQFHITGADPWIESPPTNLHGEDYASVQITMRNASDSGEAQFCWKTSEMDGFDAIHSVNFSAPNDDTEQTYTVALPLSGTITGLRFDPSRGEEGDVYVRSIRLVPVSTLILDPIGDQTGREGQLLEFSVCASSLSGASLTLSASNLPAGATFVQDGLASGTFSWTPSFTQSGTYSNVHFEVSDGTTVVSEGITITVMPGFSDVSGEHWAYDQIMSCVEVGIVAGYDDGLYHPEGTVTRDQMAVYIARAMAGGDENVPNADAYPDPSFNDVAADYWAYRHIEYAVGAEVVAGYDDGTYRPEDGVDRGQMAVYVARAKGWVGIDNAMTTAPELFPDVPAGFWAGTAVQACVENDVVRGYDDGYYRPDDVVTRDQMAVYISRAFELTL